MEEQDPNLGEESSTGGGPRSSLSALSLAAFRRDSRRRSVGSTAFMLSAAQTALTAGSRVVTRSTTASVRRTTESVALTKSMLSAKKCSSCGRQFGAEVGKRRHCRRCGEIFCYECCCDRVHLSVYHSRWGVLKNRTSKTQFVCKSCAAAVRSINPEPALAPRQRTLTEDELRKLSSNVAEVADGGTAAPDEGGDHHGRSRGGSIITKVRKTRARTLDKYMEAIKFSRKPDFDGVESSAASTADSEQPPSPVIKSKHESKHRRHNTLDDGFRYRLQAKQQQPIEVSLHRAKELRDQFFDGVSKSEQQLTGGSYNPPSPSPLVIASNDDFAKIQEAKLSHPETATSPGSSWGSFFSSLIGRVASPPPNPPASPASFAAAQQHEIDFDRAFEQEEKALEEALAQSQAQLRENEKHLKESEKQLEKSRGEQIKRMTQKLMELQEGKIKEAVQKGAVIEKQMLAHAKHLEAHIESGRFFDETEDEVVDLRDELRSVYLHLDELKVETVFPQCMRWKLRSKVEEGLFVGVRDLDLERMDCNFSIKTSGVDKRVFLHMYQIQASVALYEFVIRGNSARAKVLSRALAPTLNRVELNMTGEWYLPLIFQEGGTPDQPAARWVTDKDKSRFQFHIAKTVENASLLQLPDSFLQWLVNSLIPSLIESTVISALPTRDVGWFLCQSRNESLIRGKLQIHGDTTPRVWKAPLVGPTHASMAARRALGIDEEEAAVLDFLLRSHLACVAGFPSNKAATLAMIHTWRLTYAAHSLVALAPMLAVIESGSRMKIPTNWTLQLLRRIDELAAKPITLQIQLFDVELDLDVKELLTTITGLYLKSVEDTVAKEQELETARRAKRRNRRASELSYSPGAAAMEESRNPEEALQLARKAVARIHKHFDRTLIPLLRDQARTQFNVMLAGGSGGILAFSFTNFLADVCLPKRFQFSTILWQSPEIYEGFVLKVNGKEGPGEGEYTMRFNVLPVGEELQDEEADEGSQLVDDDDADSDEEDDAETTLKNVKIELFPIGRAPGAVHLSIDAWKSSILLNSLLKAVIASAATQPEAPPLEADLRHDALKEERRVRRNSHAQTELTRDLLIQSRQVVENLWGSFRTIPTLPEDQVSRDVIELAGGLDPLGIQFHQTSTANAALSDADSEQYTQKILMPYLTNDAFALHIDVRGLELVLKKVKSSDGFGQSMRLVLIKSMRHERDSQCVSFSMRRNLQDVFRLICFRSDVLLNAILFSLGMVMEYHKRGREWRYDHNITDCVT